MQVCGYIHKYLPIKCLLLMYYLLLDDYVWCYVLLFVMFAIFKFCCIKYDYNVLLALKMDKDPFAAGAFGTVS